MASRDGAYFPLMYRKESSKTFSSETINLIWKLFDISLHLVALHKNCEIYCDSFNNSVTEAGNYFKYMSV